MQPSKKSKKSGVKGSVALSKESIQVGCVSHHSYPRKSVLREEGKLGSNHAVKFSTGTWHHLKIRERKVHREAPFRSVNLMSATRAPPSLRTGHKTKPCTKKDAPAEKHGTWRKVPTNSKIRTKPRFTLLLKPGHCWRPLQNLLKNENSWLTPKHQRTC